MTVARRSFVRKFLRDPHSTGALAPATVSLARSVARVAHQALRRHRGDDPCGALQLLELGAGTGALTTQLRPLRPVVVERDAEWAALLRQRFPALEVRHACATEVLGDLRVPTGIVSSIPLLNNPQSDRLRELIAQRYEEGVLRFFVLYTYGWRDPLLGHGFREARREAFVARSLPPAHVWSYR